MEVEATQPIETHQVELRHQHALVSVSSRDMVGTSLTVNGVASIAVCVAAVLVALAYQQPAAIGFSLPFLVSMLLGTERHETGSVVISLDSEHARVVEGDELTFVASVSSEEGIDRCTVELAPGDKLMLLSAPRVTVRIAPNSTVQVPFAVRVVRWGLIRPEKLLVETSDAMSLFSRHYELTVHDDIRAALPALAVRETIEPGRYRDIAGSHRSESRGEGIELADIREYRAGDPLKAINWRISSRRREPWVTIRHPDRSATIVVVADTFGAALSLEPGVVRAVEALVSTHLALHDRVGALLLGSDIEWIPPQLGERQRYRITDAFIDSTRWSREWSAKPDLHRLIGRDAVVIVVSTLRDRRMLPYIDRLRAGGRHLAVLEPLVVADPNALRSSRLSPELDRAGRIDRLDRDANRRALRESGLLVVPWTIGTPLDPAMRSLRIVYSSVTGSSLSASRAAAIR